MGIDDLTLISQLSATPLENSFEVNYTITSVVLDSISSYSELQSAYFATDQASLFAPVLSVQTVNHLGEPYTIIQDGIVTLQNSTNINSTLSKVTA